MYLQIIIIVSLIFVFLVAITHAFRRNEEDIDIIDAEYLGTLGLNIIPKCFTYNDDITIVPYKEGDGQTTFNNFTMGVENLNLVGFSEIFTPEKLAIKPIFVFTFIPPPNLDAIQYYEDIVNLPEDMSKKLKDKMKVAFKRYGKIGLRNVWCEVKIGNTVKLFKYGDNYMRIQQSKNEPLYSRYISLDRVNIKSNKHVVQKCEVSVKFWIKDFLLDEKIKMIHNFIVIYLTNRLNTVDDKNVMSDTDIDDVHIHSLDTNINKNLTSETELDDMTVDRI